MVSQNSENVDQWFEKIKQKHQQTCETSSTVSSQADDYFEQLKKTYQAQKKSPADQSFLNDLERIRQEKQGKIRQDPQTSSSDSSSKTDGLTQLRNSYQSQKKESSPVSFSENIEEIRRKEQHQQQQQKQLRIQAQKWLDQLSPYSDEGFWFEQFARSYPSRLEAAIAYLDFLEKE